MPENQPNPTVKSSEFLKKVYTEIPSSYELVNRILTLGLDRIWRRHAAKIAVSHGGTMWLDMCTGTGETAVLLSRLAPVGTKLFAADFSLPMMLEACKKPATSRVNFVNADIHSLPFPDETFDLVTMSFATRNVNVNRESLIHGFSEIRRILKPGDVFVNLETSRPQSALVRKFFHLFVRMFVGSVGGRLSGSKAGFAYLSKSIRMFYGADELADIMKLAGFGEVDFERLMFGAAAVHTGRNPSRVSSPGTHPGLPLKREGELNPPSQF